MLDDGRGEDAALASRRSRRHSRTYSVWLPRRFWDKPVAEGRPRRRLPSGPSGAATPGKHGVRVTRTGGGMSVMRPSFRHFLAMAIASESA